MPHARGPYLWGVPNAVTPLASIPAGDPDTVAAASLAEVGACDGIDVILRAQNNPVRVRPYFWCPGAAAWVPLGGDAVSGASAVAATPGTLNGCAHGRFQWGHRGSVQFILHREVGAGGDVVYAEVMGVRRALG